MAMAFSGMRSTAKRLLTRLSACNTASESSKISCPSLTSGFLEPDRGINEAKSPDSSSALSPRPMMRNFCLGSSNSFYRLSEDQFVAGSLNRQQGRRLNGRRISRVNFSVHSGAEFDYGWLEEYVARRREMNGGVTHRALLVDAAGTLLIPSQPAAQVYREIGKKYGVDFSEDEILARYRWAYSQPWCKSRLRYVSDGRPFWRYIVENASGCTDKRYFEELYQYYATAEAWHLSDPEAEKVFATLRHSGVKLAVVSNFDTRLRPLLQSLGCMDWFDAIAISAEVEAEKPNPTIFLKACELLGVEPDEAVHVGDDRRNDVWGARDAGCDAWLWGGDVHSFREVANRIGVELPDD